jgi:hypothetical protein
MQRGLFTSLGKDSSMVVLHTNTAANAAFSPSLLADSAHFERWGYTVHGWFKSSADLDSRSGVLLVATRVAGSMALVDVQASADVAETYARLSGNSCWRKHATGGLFCAAIYLDQAADGEKAMTPFLQEFLRESAASQIRSLEHPACGE